MHVVDLHPPTNQQPWDGRLTNMFVVLNATYATSADSRIGGVQQLDANPRMLHESYIYVCKVVDVVSGIPYCSPPLGHALSLLYVTLEGTMRR